MLNNEMMAFLVIIKTRIQNLSEFYIIIFLNKLKMVENTK
jgi:hypothetical protein